MCRPRSSPFTSRKSNKQEKKVKYQSTEFKHIRFNLEWNACGRRWGGNDKDNHYNSMMPPEKKMKKEENGRWEGNGGGGGEVRQGGIDLPPLCRVTRQVLSAPPLPSLIYPFAHLKSVFFSLPLLSHFLSCFLSSNLFFLFLVLPTSFPTSGRLVLPWGANRKG